MAPSLKLIVEVDGGYHSQRVVADARRVVADARRARVLERLGVSGAAVGCGGRIAAVVVGG